MLKLLLDNVELLLSIVGIFVCTLLMQKQLFKESKYGDRVCSLFHHTDCNSVLDGARSKVFGISWSEIGLGFFITNALLIGLFQESFCFIAIISWMAMFFGVWSIYYQWKVAKNWCVLCVLAQIIIWLFGLFAVWICFSEKPLFSYSIIESILICSLFLVIIIAIHNRVLAFGLEKERITTIQKYRALKANNNVAKALIEEQEFHETTLNDSRILFGNPRAKMRVTILSNPHCNPCARMHERIEKLFECIETVIQNQNLRIKTGVLNEILTEAVALQQPPSDKGRRLKLYYMTQVAVKPPTFVIFVNDKELMHFSYTRYIENKVREAFGFDGTSLKFIIRERKDKE